MRQAHGTSLKDRRISDSERQLHQTAFTLHVPRRFQYLSTIGDGGLAHIHLALDREGGDAVAVKLLKPPHWGNPVPEGLLRTESSALSRIDHPGVPKLVYRPSGAAIRFFVMSALPPNSTLWAMLPDIRCNLSFALNAGIGISGVLASVHRAGVVHRDLKPENVMVHDREARRVSIVDFGFAKVSLLPDYGLISRWPFGTPEYMSPEQTYDHGCVTDGRSDVYSLGVMLYQMVAGRLPLRLGPDQHRQEYHWMHRALPPKPLSHEAPGVPEALCAAIHRALRKNPADRIQSMAEFQGILEGVRNDLP
jgi:eukaryotic-like serine/threonine-protein kinase